MTSSTVNEPRAVGKPFQSLVKLKLSPYETILASPKIAEKIAAQYRTRMETAHAAQGMRAFESPREHTALHEAGHAVLAHIDGIQVEGIRIWPLSVNDQVNWDGFTKFDNGFPDDEAMSLRNTLAGWASELLFVPKHDQRAGSSIDEIVSAELTAVVIAKKLGGDPNAIFESEIDKVFTVLRGYEVAVRKIARWLMQHRTMGREKILFAINPSDGLIATTGKHRGQSRC
ncbi:hypothetical protein [Methylocapsa palsarum]|uniref:Cell division protease FtsH n=1 Tax=Methylocapsa palsarum TaxID=1612308 RepID=A0A1I3W6Z7_9HYPH|nr:hypothetical protein [Methylocapsa palsarum]SFK03265.1 hypothetical protein SAMN05444581_101394 [Methylocapsa palsarum]